MDSRYLPLATAIQARARRVHDLYGSPFTTPIVVQAEIAYDGRYVGVRFHGSKGDVGFAEPTTYLLPDGRDPATLSGSPRTIAWERLATVNAVNALSDTSISNTLAVLEDRLGTRFAAAPPIASEPQPQLL